MRHFVLFILALIPLLGMSATSKAIPDTKFFEERIALEKKVTSLDCAGLSSTSLIKCLRIEVARSIAKEVPLSFFYDTMTVGTEKKKKTWKSLRREMALVVLDEEELEWKTIILDMPAGNEELIMRVRTEASPPFIVERLTGTSYNKMTFNVTQGEKQLLPYAAKWLRIPEGVSRTDIKKLQKESVPFLFMRTHSHMDDISLAEAGLKFLTQEIERRLQAFSLQGISSKAKAGAVVTDFIRKEHMVNLILNEQVDPDHLYEKSWEGFFVDRRHPLLYEPNRTVLIDFFTNGLDAYRYTCSKAKACGAFQFTNSSFVNEKGKIVLGTYDVVRINYPEAKLDPVFRRGVESFTNSLYAAVLLFDLELSSSNLPFWVREVIDKEESIGFVFAVIAYNGGGGRASNFARLLTKDKKYEHVIRDKKLFPWKELAGLLGKNKVMVRETFGYMLKFWHNHHELFVPVK